MITKRCIIINICLINCVVGLINVNNVNKTEAEIKLADLELKMNQTFNKYVSSILDNFLTYIDIKMDAVNQKIPELEQNITQKFNATNKNIEENLEVKINQTLNKSNKQIEEDLLEKITQMLNASNKKILDAEEKIAQSLIATNTKMNQKLEEIKKELLENERIMSAELPCKELSLVHDGVSPYYSIDSDTLNHVTLKRNSTGHLQYFELHLAIEADGWVEILLSKNKSSTDLNRYELFIGWLKNQKTRLEMFAPGHYLSAPYSTPNILSPTRYREFYIKIDCGNLEFGKEDDASSIVSTDTDGIGLVNYFRFKLNGTAAKVRYDCPAPIRGLPLPCKEKSVIYDDIGTATRDYSIDSYIFNHVLRKRTSTGHLAYFEMHFAIKGDEQVVLELQSDPENFSDPIQFQLWIGYERSKSTTTLRFDYQPVKKVLTASNLLSSTEFRAFYIKIDNGNVQFGKEGDSTPLLSHDDARLGLVNFFKINMHGGPGTIRFDCPASV